MQIKKAIITAAGYGTRFFPITKTIQKEMMPVLNRPTIDYIVDDCIKAGVEEIIFVVKPHDTQIRHYYKENKRVYEYLSEMRKLEKYESLKDLHTKAKFEFILQQPDDPYGTATPVKLAKKYVENEDVFFVFMGDDFSYHPDGSSESQKMLDTFVGSGADALASFVRKPKDELYKYGVAEYYEDNGYKFLKTLVEKPAAGSEPSDIANISKYIFTPKIFEIIEKQQLNQEHNELFITDSATQFAIKNKVVIHTIEGRYLDTGSIARWLEANLVVASENPQLREEVKRMLAGLSF